MSYFNKSFIDFFKNLSSHNSTAWFAENKKVYEKEVKEPFKKLVDEMINRIQKYQPEVQIAAADAIHRINKDIRFSKDKTPYNTHVSANISSQGKKSKEEPGFYFQLSADKIMIVGGAYMIEPATLQKIRSAITKDPKGFAAVYNDKNFKEKFGAVQGEKNKKLPDDFKAAAEKEPLIANKQFFYSAEIKGKTILQEDLPDVLMEYYKAGKKMNDYLKAAMSN
ncbi:MAG: hypothetical protein K0R82_136 [Flavipsychrobacter sp.]|jgi:uncharacterized protein (TIGR02453 family)|nr:hypothetical protein [Flavipsychrobacter sp.]